MSQTLDGKPPLWVCPRCGAKLVTKNMSHSCGPWTVERFLEGKTPEERALFDAFMELVERCGPYEVAPAKTRVAFMVRVRFATVQRLGPRGMTCTFWLKHEIDSPRFTRVERLGQTDWIYTFRVRDARELDDEVLAWLLLAYEVGAQRA